jgi:hypothetical protein
VTSRVDLGCGLGGVGVQDILAAGGPGGSIGTWPNDTNWHPPTFTRTSQNAAIWGTGGAGDGSLTGGSNAYVTRIVPFPASYTFSAIDTASLTTLYIGGTAPLVLPSPVLLQTATYESSYASQAGIGVSVALLGGQPGNPPTDNTSNGTLPPDIQCLDTPQNSASSVNTLVTPAAATLAVRWYISTSAQDLRDVNQDRILVWECRNTAGAPADADGDCLSDAADANDADTDSDNDGVPDGVEAEIGGNNAATDTDGDGASDYVELFQFTDLTDTDSDNDGQLDAPDLISTNTCSDTSAPFTDCPLGTGNQDALQVADDNCPNEANASQLNSDSLNNHHGMPGGTGDVGAPASFAHWTNPSEDHLGDACDTDDDNDALGDVAENPSATIGGGTTISGWSTTSTTVCKGPGVAAAPAVPLLTTNGDSDNDMVLDGRECQFRSRPDSNTRSAVDCPAAIPVVAVAGCGQPGNSLASPCPGQDGDADQLCLPRSTGANLNVERQFRTQGINNTSSTQIDDTDGCGSIGSSDIDADNDTRGTSCGANPEPGSQFAGLADGDETLFYNTSPTNADSDRDGCEDNEEVSDLNGTGNVSSADQLALAGKIGIPPDAGADGDVDNPGSVNFDLNKDGTVSSADQLALSRAVGLTGNCTANGPNGAGGEAPVSIGQATKP